MRGRLETEGLRDNREGVGEREDRRGEEGIKDGEGGDWDKLADRFRLL